MGSILILSDDKAIIQLVEKAVSGENHRITTIQLWHHGPGSGFSGWLFRLHDPVLCPCRYRPVSFPGHPVLLFREQEARQKLAFLKETVGDCVPWPVDQEEIARRTELLLKVKRRLDQLRAQAFVDELTKAYNRRFLGEQLKVRLGGGVATKKPRFR